jgi:CHAT domain-containing protein
VIATLWEIDDAALSGVFVELHEGLRRGLQPDEALAEAQRAAIRRGLHEADGQWAALVSIQR